MAYICKVCRKQFNNQRDYNRHNDRKIPCISSNVCNICNTRFDKPYLLKRHMNIHLDNDLSLSDDNKSYKCEKCNVEFNRNSSKKRHEQKCIILLPKAISNKIDYITIFEEDEIEDICDTNVSNCSSNSRSFVESDIILKPIYDIKKDHINYNNIKNIMVNEEVTMIFALANLFYGNINIKENHVIYAHENRCYLYDGIRWNKRRISNKFLVEFMQYIFHAAESVVLKVDPLGESNIYNELVRRRTPIYLNHYAKNYKSDFTNLLTGFKFSKISHEKWISSVKKSAAEKVKTNKVEKIDKSTTKNTEVSKSKNTEVSKSKNTEVSKSKNTEVLNTHIMGLNISPYNSDDDEYYRESMKIYKESNKLLCQDGSIIDIPPNYKKEVEE